MREQSATVSAADSSGDLRWWVRALARHERPVRGGPDDVARAARPAWVDLIEKVARNAEAELPTSEKQPFAVPLRPFVRHACARLMRDAERCMPVHNVDLPLIVEGFAVQLGRRLARTAGPLLKLEPQGWGSATQLAEKYPVLARLLGRTSQLAVESQLELLTRYVADRKRIIDALLDGTDPGRLVKVEAGHGDAHQGGRTVSVLRFADGRQIVYKPRGLQAQVCFADLIRWMNQTVPGLGLQVVKTVSGAGYGWAEFIHHRPMVARHEATRFYRRQGALLALLHAVRATDAHYENLIAVGDQPVLVDAETLFQPALPVPSVAPDPAGRALAESVQRTALLPSLVVVEDGVMDVSGLGGDVRAKTGSSHRPQLDGQGLEPADYEMPLREGFRLGYDAIMHNRSEFSRLITACADIEIRIVTRPTLLYASLLVEAAHPEVLSDGFDRDRVLNQLWQASPCPALRRLVRHEVEQLWAGDIPLFIGRPGSADLWTPDRQRLPNLFERAGLVSALDQIEAMDEADRQDQEWIISATLATRRAPTDFHTSQQSAADPVAAGAVPDPGCLLAAACGLADQIVARSMTDRNRVNWLGLELVDETHWLVLPMGAGLASGYCGVALFLAQLGHITGVTRYLEVARRAVSAVPPLFEALAARPDLVKAVGSGGFYGFGGVAYALARISALLADADIRRAAGSAVELAAIAASSPGPSGVARGTAGCLAAMNAVHSELKLAAAGRLAEICADRLVQLMELPDGRWAADAGPESVGFANGSIGIGWALARYAATGGGSGYAGVGQSVLSQASLSFEEKAGQEAVPGWCSGSAGVMAARLDSDGTPVAAPQSMLAAFVERPMLHDLSLCHGELGVIEALILLAKHDRAVVKVRQQRAGMVLDAIERHGPRCGVPGAVSTPGLLTGLAGIGYGLMRLGFGERVPSVLLLEPTPLPAGSGR
ncbi:MAG TPA: type 2 lanthipeptide synthetase LanM family protein [Micromonosporaceae bacterium]|nr:type 2 lanthipeptide synthetase LanM family protein [Micromonosporaceae bacterium]